MSLERYYLYDPWHKSESDELSKKEYDDLNSACDFLSDYISFEENITAVKNAVYEYEVFILESSVDYEFNPYSDHNYFQDRRVIANGKVLSILNSITSFRDQFPNFRNTQKPEKTREIFLENGA